MFKLVQHDQKVFEETVTESILKDMCHDTAKYDAWYAKDGDGWICFMQNHSSKRISKQLLVISE